MNLPNGLTLSRIFLVPLLVTVLLTKYNVLIAAAIFLAASLTDLLDGYLARKRGQVTTLGKLLDPVADKLVHPNAPKLESARDSASHPLTPELSGSGRPQPKVLEVAFSTKYR